MIVENEFADGELSTLCELLELLDSKLIEISSRILISLDPESDGLCDKGEYFIGVGFVAIQQYLVDTLFCTGIDKKDALKLGPLHPTGKTYITLFNSAANWWKHEAEWANRGEVPRSGEKTFIHITELTNSVRYELSNLLASIGDPARLSLSALVPYLIEWRAALHARASYEASKNQR